MQIKDGLRKEWLFFTRTRRLMGVIIAVFAVAFATPLLYKFMEILLMSIKNYGSASASGILTEQDMQELSSLGGLAGFMSSASYAFSNAMLLVCDTSMLIIALLLMSACGGEQKKRSIMIPLCSGLSYKDYLLPKFILYPATTFVMTYISGVLTAFMCNAMFSQDKISTDMVFFVPFLTAVYLTFIISVYMALGLSTARPGIAVIITFVGQSLVIMILAGLKMTRFNPFSLYSLVGSMLLDADFSLEKEAASITMAVILSVVLSVVMYFIAFTVMSAKNINNREDKPQF